MTSNSIGEPRDVPLAQLELDPQNPRLPEEEKGGSQEDLLRYMLDEYEPIVIARSISRYGFFASEPLIVIEKEGTKGKNLKYVVVEGNRRLAALRLIADADLRAAVEAEEEWDELAESADLPDEIPVVLAASREDVAPIIGYRHISGIEEWDPTAKARFIAHLIDDQAKSFSDAALIVGERETDIRSMYRNDAILEQARDEFELDTTRAEAAFGIFNQAMGNVPVRAFVGAPDPRDVDPKTYPLADEYAGELEELLSWLFGDENNPKVIGESRDITRYLTTILQSDDALEVLRDTRNLELAFITAGGTRDRLLRRLANARGSLQAAREDIDEHVGDKEVIGLVDECAEAVTDLREAL
jgi:hypothetical protein